MADWETRHLGDVAQLKMGQSPPGSLVTNLDRGLPFLQGNAEFGARRPTATLQCDEAVRRSAPGDSLISVRAPVGAINRADRGYGIGRGLAAVTFGMVDPDFGHHALVEWSRDLQRVSQGTTFTAIGRIELAALQLPLPPLEEQRRIAEILDTIDEAIQATERVIAKKEMELDGLAAHLMSDSSPFREWDERHLGEWTQAGYPITYGIVQAGPHIPNGIPYIRTGDMRTELRIEGLLRTSKRIAESYARSRVSEGDIVCAIRATVGKVLVVPPELEGANLTQGTARIAPGPNADRYCLLWALRSEEVKAQIRAVQKGTTFQEITLYQLRTLVVRLPANLSDQRRLAATLRAVEAAVRTEHLALDKLRELRSGLAADLLSGRMRTVAA